MELAEPLTPSATPERPCRELLRAFAYRSLLIGPSILFIILNTLPDIHEFRFKTKEPTAANKIIMTVAGMKCGFPFHYAENTSYARTIRWGGLIGNTVLLLGILLASHKLAQRMIHSPPRSTLSLISAVLSLLAIGALLGLHLHPVQHLKTTVERKGQGYSIKTDYSWSALPGTRYTSHLISIFPESPDELESQRELRGLEPFENWHPFGFSKFLPNLLQSLALSFLLLFLFFHAAEALSIFLYQFSRRVPPQSAKTNAQ